MVINHADKLNLEFSDKYVAVDDSRPELRRFKGLVGQIVTVNKNGRALVEFNGPKDLGRHDIEIDFLRVVEKPVEEPAAKKPVPKKAKPAEKEPSALEKARKANGKDKEPEPAADTKSE
jgi:hypothetical protein